jgi:putative nucleotidyltransferase with HDIG domain
VLAAYSLGTRSGGATALLSFLIVTIYAIASPARFTFAATTDLLVFDLLIWGSFLGLTGLVIGQLSDDRRRRIRELKSAYVGVLEILAKFLESADHYTKSHSVRVAELSSAVAAELGLSDDEIENIRAGALLHDIGKADCMELVKRASALADPEQREMSTHTVRGAALVRSVGAILKETVPIILYHHHYYGGRDGQEGPVGEHIPLGARIVAVADAYDAIVTDRPYRKGRAPWQAILEIENCASTQFDPRVVQAFKRIMPGDSDEPERELDEIQNRGEASATEPAAQLEKELDDAQREQAHLGESAEPASAEPAATAE